MRSMRAGVSEQIGRLDAAQAPAMPDRKNLWDPARLARDHQRPTIIERKITEWKLMLSDQRSFALRAGVAAWPFCVRSTRTVSPEFAGLRLEQQ
jgi:hypothetical protein